MKIDPRYFLPTEVDLVLRHANKARRQRGWRSEIGLGALLSEMVAQDLIAVGKERRRNND